jgi:hypothetical protein
MSPHQQDPIWAVPPVKVFALGEKLAISRATRWRF